MTLLQTHLIDNKSVALKNKDAAATRSARATADAPANGIPENGSASLANDGPVTDGRREATEPRRVSLAGLRFP